MGILTNKLDIRIDYDALFSDFDIYCIMPDPDRLTEKNARSDFWQGRCIVDSALHEMKALSSAYNNHAEAFLLFPKSDRIKEDSFARSVEKAYPGFLGVRLRKSQFLEQTPEHDRRFYFGNRVIVQLLVNSLANYMDDGRYHNLSASLLCLAEPEKTFPLSSGEKGRKRVYLDFRIEAGLYLKVSVRTFRSLGKNGTQGTKYVYDPAIADLRRALPSDGKDFVRFEDKGFKGKKNIITFLDFSNIDSFEKSRAGAMLDFVREVNQRMGKYIQLSFHPFDESTAIVRSKYLDKNKMFAKLKKHFEDHAICIRNDIGEAGEEAFAKLEEVLENRGINHKVISCGKKIPLKKPAIILLHPQEWYVKNKEEDPYLLLHGRQKILQAVTEDAMKSGEAVVLTLLKELRIKEDLLNGKMSLLQDEDSAKPCLSKPWYFVFSEKDETDNGKDALRTFYRMKLDPNGDMTFDSFTNKEFSLFTVKGRIQDAYDVRNGNEFLSQDEYLEGIMYCDEDNLHRIVRTNWWALPNLENIHDALSFSDGNRLLSANQVLDALDAFEAEKTEFCKDAEAAKEMVGTLGSRFTLRDLNHLGRDGKKVFSWQSAWVKEFSLFWFRNSKSLGDDPPVLLISYLKTNPESKGGTPLEYGLWDVTDVQTFTHFVPALLDHQTNGGRRLYARSYFSGIRIRAMEQKFDRGSVIRNIIPEKEDQSMEVLPLLDTDYVRSNGMLPVLPLPFKYLREYAEASKRKGVSIPRSAALKITILRAGSNNEPILSFCRFPCSFLSPLFRCDTMDTSDEQRQ